MEMANNKLTHQKLMVTTIHKCGSMFLYKYFKLIASLTNVPYYSRNNNPVNDFDYETSLNGILSPVREMREAYQNELVICQIRNPLDILVSRYFSFGFMHNLIKPEKGKGSWPGINVRDRIKELSIDEYCIKESDLILELLQPVNDFIKNENVLMISYFNMVHDFEFWNEEISDWLDLNNTHKKLLLNEFKNEFDVEELNPDLIVQGLKKRHKRKIFPGDAYFKLKPDTIKLLEEKFNSLNQIVDNLKTKSALLNHGIYLNKEINSFSFPTI